MKSQTAAEVIAACSLARAGWRPARGALLVVVLAARAGTRWAQAAFTIESIGRGGALGCDPNSARTGAVRGSARPATSDAGPQA